MDRVVGVYVVRGNDFFEIDGDDVRVGAAMTLILFGRFFCFFFTCCRICNMFDGKFIICNISLYFIIYILNEIIT